jgi:hypothetical protein
MTLLPEEGSFLFWAAAQLPPDVRSDFLEQVVTTLSAHPNPDCGDLNRVFPAPRGQDWSLRCWMDMSRAVFAGIGQRR